MEIIKNVKKSLVVLMTVVMIMCSGTVMATSIPNDAAINQFVDANLGLLKDKITKQERDRIYELAKSGYYLNEKRKSQNKLNPGVIESMALLSINKELERCTIKHLLNGKEHKDMGFVSENDEENTVLEAISDVISVEDYNEIQTLIDNVNAGDYYAADKIQKIIEKYDDLDADIVMSYMCFSSGLQLNARFNINEDLTINYNPVNEITPYELPENMHNKYNAVWSKITHILPKEGLANFDELYFSTDGEYSILASVTPNDDIGSRWILNIDPEDAKISNSKKSVYEALMQKISGDEKLFYETIIHEYFHYLSLNDTQVDYTEDYDMRNYCEMGVVSKPNSYINKFSDKFWKNILNDRRINEDSYYFYARHKDEFVGEYASTSPAEDIAESFSYFVLNDKPTGNTIKDEKIKFFYQYDELVKLRDLIRANIGI